MRYDYVVIEREYGSGGTGIGELLSEKMGIPCYGAQILEEVSEKLGIPVADIQSYEENTTNSFLYSLYAFGKITDGTETFLSGENRIFLEEQEVIRARAMEGPAIFVGRCAASALGDRRVLTAFIHADHEVRRERAIKEYGIPANTANSVMTKFDRKRRNYYLSNTGNKWYDWNNYEMVLDSGKLGREGCAEAICAAMRAEFAK